MAVELKLDVIASRLAALEETLIYKLLDRAQFGVNEGAYRPGSSAFVPAEAASLFDLRLTMQERLDTAFGRYRIPEERPYTQGLPEPRRRPPLPDTGLGFDDYETVNVGEAIRAAYLALVPGLARPGDDGQWGSAVEHDVICLQALGRRIHFGALYVGESKFREDPAQYTAWVKARDDGALRQAITRVEVEQRILGRVRAKVEAVQAVSDPGLRRLVDPEVLVRFFDQTIFPLTKDGEMKYLYRRAQ